MLKKLSLFLVVIILTLLFHSAAHSQNMAITNGLLWLSSNQNSDGSWGGALPSIDSQFDATFQVINTIAAIDNTMPAYNSGVQWIMSQPFTYTEILARRIIILSQNGDDTSTDVATLLSYRNIDGYWGEEADLFNTNNNLDTVLALQALNKINYQDQNTISSALFFLTNYQNSDGSFGFYQGDDSNVYMTALALQTLSQFKTTYDLNTPIANAAAWLLANQNADGGFGSGGTGQGIGTGSTTYETALTLIALINGNTGQAQGQPLQIPIQNAINYLTATQLPNGSWDDDPYSTALALRALAGFKPNLALSSPDVTYTPSSPTPGDIVTITAIITNKGLADANSITVSFFDGDPNAGGAFVGEGVIGSIPAGGTGTASTNWTATTPGIQNIFVLVDPANAITEESESDNIAVVQIRVYEKIDLAIQNIAFVPELPSPGQPVEVQVKVANNGGRAAANILARLIIDGAPVGDKVILSLDSLHGEIISFALIGLPSGLHQITANVDPNNTISEGNKTNNILTIAIDIQERIDLNVNSGDILYSIAEPKEGEILQISALITNSGESTAGNILVRFFDGNPQTGGLQIGSDQIISSIPAKSKTTTGWVSFNTLGKSGLHHVYVIADPLSTIYETNEQNNTGIKAFTISGRSDLIVQDIQFTPAEPEEGDLVTIKAVAKNIGSIQSGVATLKFHLGDASGEQIGTDQNIGPMNPSLTFTTGNMPVIFNTAEKVGNNLIHAVLDPYSEVDEINEINNTLTKTLIVKPSTRPDLTLTSTDISFTPSNPLSGDAVTITAKIKNLKNFPASNVPVSFYNGSPAGGGTLISTLTVQSVEAMGLAVVETTWDTTGQKGKKEIYVKIDPDNTVPEANELNNQAFRVLKMSLPLGAAPVGLTASSVNATDIGLAWQPGPEAAAYGIIGYNVYRNDFQLNSMKDIAREGTASASSTHPVSSPTKAVDGDATTVWFPPSNPVMPVWWQDSFAAQRKVWKVVIKWNQAAKDFQIQTWDGAQWVTQATITGNLNTTSLTIHEFPSAVMTDKVRVNITSMWNLAYPCYIYEIDIYEDRLIQDLSYQDTKLANGAYVYYATAVDGDGAESLPSNEAGVSLGDVTLPAPPTGLASSVNGFNVSLNWNANAEPDLAGYRVYRDGLNVAHKDRGAFAFSNSLDNFDSLIDGVTSNWATVHWDSNPAGTMTVVLPKTYSIDRLRMLLYEYHDGRFYRYFIESSLDGRVWQTVVDKSSGEWNGWQEFVFPQPVQAKYFRITGTLCSTEALFKVSEFEAYSPELAPKTLDTTTNLQVSVYNYGNFYEYIYDWNSGSRQPRKFAFAQFNAEEKDSLVITDKDTGAFLARYAGDISPFLTPSLTATNYRFYFSADYEGTASGFKVIKYMTAGKQTARTFSETIYNSDLYQYAVTAVDTSGNESPFSSIVTANVTDSTRPATPRNLAAKAGNRVVDLTWTANTEPDLAGYNLYRNGSSIPLNGGTLIPHSSYADLDVTNLTVYTYQITAVDVNGNESPRSASVTAIPSGVDLVVESLSYVPFPAQRNEAMEISAFVRNKGDQDCPASFKVSFFKGTNANGMLIGISTVQDLPAGQTVASHVPWTPTDFVSDVFVVIDQENVIPEYDETNNTAAIKTVAFENRKRLYSTYTHTLQDLVLFGYRNNTETAVFMQDGSYVWAGNLDDGSHPVVSPTAEGIYKIYGSQPYSVLSGDPVSGHVMGYYALDEKNMGLSRDIYTYMVSFSGDGCKFIVFAYEDNTEVTVLNSETGAVIWQGVLNKGGHYENGVERDVSGKFLRVTSSKPVSALSYTDQGYFIPSENGTFYGRIFYTYAGSVGGWQEDLNIFSFENNTSVTLRDTDTGQIVWQGILNEGDVHSHPILGYYTIESDKKITAGVYPYLSSTYGYWHMAVAYGPAGSGIGRLFYTTAIDEWKGTVGALHMFSYQDENAVKVTDWLKKQVIWEGVLHEGDYKRIDTVHTIYKIESSRNLSVIEAFGSDYGADFVPTYFVAVTDLEATAIDILPAEVYPGDNTLIVATVSNMGDTNQDDVVVDIFVDGVKISSSTINLPPHSASLVEANWQAVEGNHAISVVVDHQDSVPEQNEMNNIITINREVSYPAPPPVLPDLSITPSDIVFSKVLPSRGEGITISAALRNKGTGASNVLVLAFLGDPKSGGTQTGSSTLLSIPANSAATVKTPWIVDRTTGTYDICIWIDPYNLVIEGNETDNIACKALTVREKKITVNAMTDKAQYHANSNVGITVSLINQDAIPWTGTGEVLVKDPEGNLVSHVATFTPDTLQSVGLAGWIYRVPVSVSAQWNMQDALADGRIDFVQVLQTLGVPNQHVDANSIRVIEFGPDGSLAGEKHAKAVFETPALTKVTWLIDGVTATGTTRYFYIYFDTVENGSKVLSSFTKLPSAGKLIAYSDDGGKVYTVRNNGDGTFGSAVFVDKVSPASTFSYTQGLALDDFNSDGFPDIVTGSGYSNELYYYQNKADGTDTFLPKTTIDNLAVTSGYVYDMASADFNNDGNMDFVASGKLTALYLYLGNGNGAFIKSSLPLPSQNSVFAKTSADVDGDGNIDLVISSGNSIYYYRGNGDGTFQSPVNICTLSNGPIYGLTAGDFDNDGKIDIIASYRWISAISYFLKGVGDGTFIGPVVIQSLGDLNTYTAFDSGDLNNDGNMDILTATSWGTTVDFYPGNGDGTFGLKTNLAVTVANTPDHPLGISSSRAMAEVHPMIGLPEAMPSQVFTFIWNTGSTAPGNYKVHVTLSEGQGVVAEDNSPFDILPDATISSKVVSDRISYSSNQSVTLTSTITSQSANYIFENLAATTTITNSQGTVLHTETNTIPILTQGQLAEIKTYWNTSTHPAGAYPVTLEIRDSAGTLLSTSGAILTISSDIKPSKLLKGQISLDKQQILQGEPVAITYSVTNIGNDDLPAVDLSVLTVHVVQMTTYDTLIDQTVLLMGQTYGNTQVLNTQNYSAKDYLVILRATISGVQESLAGTYLRVEGAPSVPSLNAPVHLSDVKTLTPVVTVNNATDPNDDQLTYEFELYTDLGLTSLVASSGTITEGAGTTSWQIPVDLTENAVYYWRARAYDGILFGEWMEPAAFRVNVVDDPPGAPLLSSPSEAFSVDTATPLLTVINATDPDSNNLTYNFVLALDPALTQVVASETGIFGGAGTTSWGPSIGPGQGPLSLQENTWYYWTAQADDWLTEGLWMATASFFINTSNEAPTQSVIISPLAGSEVTNLNAEIVIANSTDPESQNITYVFEIDTLATFDSHDLERFADVPGGSSTTAVSVSGLRDNTSYCARAKASDGLAQSAWAATVCFFVNTVNDTPSVPVLANPSDKGAVNVARPVLSVYNSTDTDRDGLTYDFEVYGDSTLSLPLASFYGVPETAVRSEWTLPVNLTENSIYYWRARAFDGQAQSGWMPLASFMVNTANDAPGAPALYLPAQGSSLATLRPALSVYNATDPDSDNLTYDFEIYSGSTLAQTVTGIPENSSGITSVSLNTDLADNTTYSWRAKAYDGDRYGPWMDMATFSTHLPSTNITVSLRIEPETLERKSCGKWISAEIRLPEGYRARDIQLSSILLEGKVHAEPWPYETGCWREEEEHHGRGEHYESHGHDDRDHDGERYCEETCGHSGRELRVKFRRSEVLNVLPNGDRVHVHVTGLVGTTTFEGVDTIRVMK